MAKRAREENKRRPVVAFYTQKGGVAKTTSLLAMMARATQNSERVLVIDCDPQMNASAFLAAWKNNNTLDHDLNYRAMVAHYRARNKRSEAQTEEDHQKIAAYTLQHRNLYDLMMLDTSTLGLTKTLDAVPAIGYEVTKEVTLISSHPMLTAYESNLAFEVANRQFPANYMKRLSMLIDYMLARYGFDLVLLDMGPSNSLLNQMVLATASFFVMPLVGDRFTTMVLDTLDLFLEQVKHNFSAITGTKERACLMPKLVAVIYGRYGLGDEPIILNCHSYKTTLEHKTALLEIKRVLEENAGLSAYMMPGATYPVMIRDEPAFFMQLSYRSATLYDEDVTSEVRPEYDVLWEKLVAALCSHK